MTSPDMEDVRACLKGDEEAYGRLVERHKPQIAAQMWRLCRDRTTCEELVQEVFVEAYFSLPTYRGEAPLLPWLRRIATRIGYRYCRKTAGRPPHLPIEDWDPAKEAPRSLDPVEAGALVHALLARLEPEDRLVMTMIYLEECSTAEIAERTGWSQGAVKMRASRSRDRLRKIVEKERLLEGREWNL